MTNILLAGGGTAGHVNPLLAVAGALRGQHPDFHLVVLGTQEGLESRLVPQRGYELLTIPRVPFPRRFNRTALRFPARYRTAVKQSREILRDRDIDVVVGFGGYVSMPVYAAARALGIPVVIHEANAKPGLANRVAAKFAAAIGVTFPATPLSAGQTEVHTVGLPLRAEIQSLVDSSQSRQAARTRGLKRFGLSTRRPVLLVTSGSLGARSVNAAVASSIQRIIDTGWQVLHITGSNNQSQLPKLDGYVALEYCDHMDEAFAVADAAISRAGAATVSELTALAIPAVYVPYPVGNGEQAFNAASVVEAGGALVVPDATFTPDYVATVVCALLRNTDQLDQMRSAASSVAVIDGTARMLRLIHGVLT